MKDATRLQNFLLAELGDTSDHHINFPSVFREAMSQFDASVLGVQYWEGRCHACDIMILVACHDGSLFVYYRLHNKQREDGMYSVNWDLKAYDNGREAEIGLGLICFAIEHNIWPRKDDKLGMTLFKEVEQVFGSKIQLKGRFYESPHYTVPE